MEAAFDAALKGVSNDEGGPFGAVVVKGEKIVGCGHNTVIRDVDPTAHAEINAIRDATKSLGRIHLEDAVIYTTCEPCPMCLSAIYWANIQTVYYSMDRFDANKLGFSDAFIYREISKPAGKMRVQLLQVKHRFIENLVSEWMKKDNRLSY